MKDKETENQSSFPNSDLGTGTIIKKIFKNLDDSRGLPGYQMERRADIFFSVYIKELMEKRTEERISEVVIPEFPVKRGIVHEGYKPNRSYKIDYILFNEAFSKAYFVELKTDSGSRRESQDVYLRKAKQAGMGKLLEGVKKLFGASDSRGKRRAERESE